MLQLQAEDSDPKRHVMPRDYFTALTEGHGDSEVVDFLWSTQRSRRLLLITMLFDEAERHPELLGNLPPAAPALRVLAQAQADAPDAIDTLLLDPQVGAWAAYAMRRRRTDAVRDGDSPLWCELGGIHVLTLVAAARAGLSWQTRLPHRQGRVLVFGTGMAYFPDVAEDELIDAETADGLIRLKAGHHALVLGDSNPADEPHWQELRRLRAGTEPALTVALDDIDPFRDLADPVPPAHLDDASVERWRNLLDEAWVLLCEHFGDIAGAIAAGVVSLVPLPAGDGRETRSASSGESFGRVMVSPPPDGVTLALSLVHEFQHIKLGGLMHLVQLTDEDNETFFYAPWRDDPRPIGGLLQGVYAFFGIAGFWRRYRETVSGIERELADFEFAYARIQAGEGIGVVAASGKLTEAGRELVDGLSARLAPWLVEEVGPTAEAAARTVADHHRMGWRIRHQRVLHEEVSTLAAAWRGHAQAAVTSEPQVGPAPAIRWSQDMIELVRRRILYPDSWQAVQEATACRREAEVHPGDIALVGGDAPAALSLYSAALHDRYKDLDIWSGLALAVDADRSAGAARALRDRPELVQAVYAELAELGQDPDPVRVAAWLGEALSAV